MGLNNGLRSFEWRREEDPKAYSFWNSNRFRKNETKENKPISRSALIEMISTMNLANSNHCATVVDAIERTTVPWILVGSATTGVHYRLLPRAWGLRSDRVFPRIKPRILNENILGVNTYVQPLVPIDLKSRRKRGLAFESSDLNVDSDWTEEGFVFHQLGSLKYWSGDYKALQNPDLAKDGSWRPTGFSSVIRFNSDGAPNGIYIIYDFYRENYPGGGCDEKLQYDDWGYLPGSRFENQFAVT